MLVKTNHEIAETLGKSVRWVKKWFNRFNKDGSVQDRPKSGRPTKLTSRVKEIIRKTKGRRNQSCRRVTKRLRNLGEQVSKTTVNEYRRKKLGFKAYKRGKVPRLTKIQKQRRFLSTIN